MRTEQHEEWDETFWNTNHEHRKAKAQKVRNKGLKSSAIRQGIDDYFNKSRPKASDSFSDDYDDFDFYDHRH